MLLNYIFSPEDCNEVVDETEENEDEEDDEEENDVETDDEGDEKGLNSSDKETTSETEEEEEEQEEDENNLNIDETPIESEEERRIQKLRNSCKIVVNKIRTIVKKYNRSNPLRLYVLDLKAEKRIDVNFYHDFKVRWNTTFIMLDRALKLKTVINEITNNSESIPNLTVRFHKLMLNKSIFII